MRTTTVVWDETSVNETTFRTMMGEGAANITGFGFEEHMTRTIGPSIVDSVLTGSTWHTITRSWPTLEAAEQWITFVTNHNPAPVSAVINPE